MRKVLIAHGSEELTNSLAQMLVGKFDTICCTDGNAALDCIARFRPEILILDLMLPYIDGFSVLEQAHEFLPSIILGIARNRSCYVLQSAAVHSIGYVMLEPCEAKSVVIRLMDMVACADLPTQNIKEPQSEITQLLLGLGLRPSLDGFSQLQVALPLFLQDTAQRLSKELYPAVARLCGCNSGVQVEHSIRTAIRSAWCERDITVWEYYFPHCLKAPTNKEFIARLAAALQRKI